MKADDGTPPGRLLWDEHDGVVVATLAQPRRQNALTSGMLSDLRHRLTTDTSRAVVVLSGAGPNFCSGFDLGELEAGGRSEARRNEVSETVRTIEEHPQPVLAAIRGNCVGAGLELALGCDFRVADSTARFAMPPSKLGIVYPWTGVRRMVEAIGPAWTRYLLYTACTVEADRALSIGLVQEVASDDAIARAHELAALISNKRAPLSVRGAKLSVAAVSRPPVDQALAAQCDDLVEQALASGDHRAALDARRDGRAPTFEGR